MKETTKPPNSTGRCATRIFEIFVQDGFSDYELASVTATLQAANKIGKYELFDWRFVSDNPGLVKGSGGSFVRAAPSIPDHGLADWMIVIGSEKPNVGVWLKRARLMQSRGLITVLLSGAATAYIKVTNVTDSAITTHWRDTIVLQEIGYYPGLTSRFSEKSGGIITSAGSGSTSELVIGLIADFMAPQEVAELGSYLLIHTIRSNDTEQPKHISDNTNLFDHRISQAVKLMEGSIEEPIPVNELSKKVGLSTRQLERIFNDVFNTSPARFYRQLRIKRARVMLVETQMSLADVASATGFTAASTLSKAFRDEFGESPREVRVRNKIRLL